MIFISSRNRGWKRSPQSAVQARPQEPIADISHVFGRDSLYTLQTTRLVEPARGTRGLLEGRCEPVNGRFQLPAPSQLPFWVVHSLLDCHNIALTLAFSLITWLSGYSTVKVSPAVCWSNLSSSPVLYHQCHGMYSGVGGPQIGLFLENGNERHIEI